MAVYMCIGNVQYTIVHTELNRNREKWEGRVGVKRESGGREGGRERGGGREREREGEIERGVLKLGLSTFCSCN